MTEVRSSSLGGLGIVSQVTGGDSGDTTGAANMLLATVRKLSSSRGHGVQHVVLAEEIQKAIGRLSEGSEVSSKVG